MPKSWRARGRSQSRGSRRSGRSTHVSTRPSSTPGPSSSPPSLQDSGQDPSVAGPGYSEFLDLIREEVHQQLCSQMGQSNVSTNPVPLASTVRPGGIESPSSNPLCEGCSSGSVAVCYLFLLFVSLYLLVYIFLYLLVYICQVAWGPSLPSLFFDHLLQCFICICHVLCK